MLLSRCRLALLMAAAISWLTLCFQPAPASGLGWEAVDLGGLPEIRAVAGILSATLVARAGPVRIGAVEFAGALYNGSYGGPVLRVHAGDIARITLVNRLSEPTNLHFHGLRITPLGRGDNMAVSVQPGESYTYEFRIPRDHPPGLFWYHDHTHGRADAHVMAGLSGALLVDGFAAEIPGLGGVAQKLLVLKDYTAPGCSGAWLKGQLHCRVLSVDGIEGFNGSLQPGETQLWRICNQGADLTIHLSLPGFSLKIVGRDGLPAARAEAVASIDVMPASRLDVLVTAGAVSGQTDLVAHMVPTGSGAALRIERRLGIVTVAGAATTQSVIPGMVHQVDLRGSAIGERRRIVFSEDAEAGKYYIDGRRFDAQRIDLHVPLGHVEEWTIENHTQDFHEFHIHQMGFQVVEVDGKPFPFAGFVDDVEVPAMGQVKLLLPFLDRLMLGVFMYHCHVLRHEDGGMMAMIEVYDPLVGPAAHLCLGLGK
jgi:FtsP/CotA-like multicopper oxidase with cupredoxin domain